MTNLPLIKRHFFIGFITAILHSPSHEWSVENQETLKELITFLGDEVEETTPEPFKF